MAFFSEVKAKLGLDISEFERGMSKAQSGVGELGNKMAKKIGGAEKIGSTLAVALGLNIQNIADNFARMFTGVTKNAEDFYERANKASDENLAVVLKNIEARQTEEQKLASKLEQLGKLQAPEKPKPVEKVGEQSMFSKFAMGVFNIGAPIAAHMAKSEAIAKSAAESTEKTLKINKVSGEIEELKRKAAEDRKKKLEAIADLEAKGALINKSDSEQQEFRLKQIEELQAKVNSGDLDAKAKQVALFNEYEAAQKRIDEDKKKSAQELADLEQQGFMDSLSDQDKLMVMADQIAELKRDSNEDDEEAQKKILKLTNDRAAIQRKVDDERNKKQDEYNKKVEKLGTALADQAKATFGEVVSGERGTATDRARAQQAEQLRQRARAIIDQGGAGAADRAAVLTARADKIQQSLESTKSSEKTSLSSEFTSALDNSAVLEAIKQYLSPTKT